MNFFPLLFRLVPSEPQEVRAEALSSTSLHVSWILPANPFGIIVSYVVYYQEAGKENGYNKTNAIKKRFFEVLTALKENTKYDVFVQASTSAGGGRWSEVTTVKTSPGSKKLSYYLAILLSINFNTKIRIHIWQAYD